MANRLKKVRLESLNIYSEVELVPNYLCRRNFLRDFITRWADLI